MKRYPTSRNGWPTIRIVSGRIFCSCRRCSPRHNDKPAILRLLRTLAARYPAVPEASLAVAQAAWNADDQPAALEASRNALKLRPDWELAALFQARALQRNSVDEAIDFLGDFVKAHPGARDARLNYARLLVSARALPRSAQAVRNSAGRGTEQCRHQRWPWRPLSMQAKDYAAAEIQLKRALEINPKDPDTVRLYLGQVNEELKRDR